MAEAERSYESFALPISLSEHGLFGAIQASEYILPMHVTEIKSLQSTKDFNSGCF